MLPFCEQTVKIRNVSNKEKDAPWPINAMEANKILNNLKNNRDIYKTLNLI